MVKPIPVTEDTLHNAVNNAPFFARKRLFKKLDKTVYPRHGEFIGKQVIVTSELTGLPLVRNVGSVERRGRRAKNLEAYFEMFVQAYYKASDEKA